MTQLNLLSIANLESFETLSAINHHYLSNHQSQASYRAPK